MSDGLVVHKFKIDYGRTVISSSFVDILHFEMWKGDPFVWASVFDRDDPFEMSFFIIGTGQRVPNHAKYVGSCTDGPFVWHLYQIITSVES